MGFQDRDYVKEKHKTLEQQEKQNLQNLINRSKKQKISWTYIGGIVLILAAIIKEIYFR
ncbi:MAG: hypothetical protein HXM22_08460 [Haemophilus parainfluenzae]|jgi:hypothetical protein|nr:hypothetical protein [Haemophilus parainfluenzae]